MKTIGSIRPALMCVLLATGCSQKMRTQEWYAEHLDDADTRVRWCREQRQENKLSLNPEDPVNQDCQNAAFALAGAQVAKLREQ